MEHIHLKECESTQSIAIELLENQENFIVSCENQTKGRGQGVKHWDSLGNCISLSFDLKAAVTISLTSLELGILICQFFKAYYQKECILKWPNDILNNKKEKCGGILINNSAKSKMIAGIGINLSSNTFEVYNNYRIPAGFLFDKEFKSNKEAISYNIVQYIHQNRLSELDIVEKWNALCAHLNQEVIIFDEEKELKGYFKGIGKYGQAIIETSNGLVDIYSGSLKLLS